MQSIPRDSSTSHPGTGQCVISAVELLVGSVVVIGHNVFHILPNEVPILVVLKICADHVDNEPMKAIGELVSQ